MNGIVTKFCVRKGYGYIKPIDSGPDVPFVFFHVLSVVGSTRLETVGVPPEGSEVTFKLVRGNRGTIQAADVQVVQLGEDALTQAKHPSIFGNPRDLSTREIHRARQHPQAPQPIHQEMNQ